MELSTSQKTIVKIAAFLGIVQGLTWLIMSCICMGIYYQGLGAFEMPTSYMEYVNVLIEARFLDFNFVNTYSPYIIEPVGFAVFMAIYAVWDATWIVSSVQIYQVSTGKSAKPTKRLRSWWILTLCLTLLDIIFSILLLVDYSKCLDLFEIDGSVPIEYGMVCANSTLPVLVIVGRGYVLLIINIIMIYLIFQCMETVIKKNVNSRPIHPTV